MKFEDLECKARAHGLILERNGKNYELTDNDKGTTDVCKTLAEVEQALWPYRCIYKLSMAPTGIYRDDEGYLYQVITVTYGDDVKFFCTNKPNFGDSFYLCCNIDQYKDIKITKIAKSIFDDHIEVLPL